ncbi:MAG: hypothetical protein J6W08_01245 [Alphaproteobacteria bacterium]|nr:hypothetical protein [Alphaproteobacteria bacterium]
MRHLISNIICGFIWSKRLRDKVRTRIRFPQTRDYVRYVRKFARNMEQRKIRTLVGYGCKNFIVILNNKHVFKFPLLTDGKDVSIREKRIVDAFYGISPIKIPLLKVIPYKNIYIRKYEFAKGTLLTDVSPKVIAEHSEHIAKQIAKFLYVIGKQDPVEIRDLKPNQSDRPGFLYGWCQDDIWQNFMLDTKTFDITFFIDWENTKFADFRPSLYVSSHNWDKFGYRSIMINVIAEYAKLYFKKS